MATATYTYPGAPACLCCPNHVCAYACALEVRAGDKKAPSSWRTDGDDAAEEAVARYLAQRSQLLLGAPVSSPEATGEQKKKCENARKKARPVIACAVCDQRCIVYANNQRPYPLVNPATGKPAPLHSEMALVCTTCAFDAPDPLGDKKDHHTINSTKKTDVRNAFFMCPQCTAYTHAGLAAAKRCAQP